MAVVQSVPSPRARLGAWGEQHAAERLAELGWQIVARNWRGSCGELDLIALEPRPAGPPIGVVVEVKTRSQTNFGDPLEAISAAKLSRLYRLAFEWARASGLWLGGVRVDVVGIVKRRGFAPEVTHRRGVA